MNSILDRFTKERSLIYIIIGAIVLVIVIVIYLFVYYGGKSLKITSPLGGEEWQIGQTYSITWEARGIDRVGIALFNGTEVQWIAENINAGAEKYDWKVYPDQGYGDGFWVSVFEYPWKENNIAAYTSGAVAVTYSELSSCDNLSVGSEWPYVASDFPGLRKVFITKDTYTGNLGGFDGADNICQTEAKKMGLKGDWMAFIGGEDDAQTAVERLEKSPRGISGIFAEAIPSETLDRGSTCHRVLGKNFESFLEKFSDLKIVNQDKMTEDFIKKIQDVWVGRINNNSKKSCVLVTLRYAKVNLPIQETYSLTTTCYNWTIDQEFVEGYPVDPKGVTPSFPFCYTPSGNKTSAVALAGLASGLSGTGNDEASILSMGKACWEKRHLLCVEK